MIVYATIKYLGYSLWYFAIYTPLRLLVISFARDAVSPDGLAVRLCVGRCLC